MSNRTSQFAKPIGRQVGARVQQPSCILVLEAVKLEIICSKKNSRSVYASADIAKSSKIIGLISDDRNLQEVKEKLIHVDNAFTRLQEAHHDYSSESMDEDGILKYQLYLGSEERKFGLFFQQITGRLDNCDWRETPRRLASTRFSCKTWRLNKLCWRVRTMKGIKSL